MQPKLNAYCIPNLKNPPHTRLVSLLLRLNSILNSRQQRFRVRTHNLLHLLLTFKDQECRHGSDSKLLCYVWDFVDVELDEVRGGEFVGESVI